MKLNLKITGKILLWSFFLIIASTLVFYLFLMPLMEKQLVKTKEDGLKNVVESAVSICKYYDSLDNAQKLSAEDFLKWKQHQALTTIKKMKYGKSGYLWINDFQPKMIMHPNFSQEQKPEWYKNNGLVNYSDPNGIKLFVEFVKVCESHGEGFVYYHWPQPGDPINKPSPKTSFVKAYNPWGWIIGSGVYTDDVKNFIMIIVKKSIIIILLTLIFLMTLAILFAFSFTKPLKKATAFSNKIKEGNLTESLNIKTGDEIETLSQSLSSMKDKLFSIAHSLNLTTEELANSSDRLQNTYHETKQISEIQFASVQENKDILDTIIANTEKIADKSQNQSADVEEVTAAIEELTASVNQEEEIALNVKKSSEESLNLVSNTEAASNKTIESMKAIEDSAEKINQVTGVINDIADQTNLLALNASIEAARAGEAGRGFAVVAKEISNLADKSSVATKEIASLISETNINVKEGAAKLNNFSSSIQSIKETLTNITQSATTMSQASLEEKTGFEQISKAVQNVNTAAQDVASLNLTQVSTAKTVKDKTNELFTVTDNLKSAIEDINNSISVTNNQIQKIHQISSMFKIAEEE